MIIVRDIFVAFDIFAVRHFSTFPSKFIFSPESRHYGFETVEAKVSQWVEGYSRVFTPMPHFCLIRKVCSVLHFIKFQGMEFLTLSVDEAQYQGRLDCMF